MVIQPLLIWWWNSNHQWCVTFQCWAYLNFPQRIQNILFHSHGLPTILHQLPKILQELNHLKMNKSLVTLSSILFYPNVTPTLRISFTSFTFRRLPVSILLMKQTGFMERTNFYSFVGVNIYVQLDRSIFTRFCKAILANCEDWDYQQQFDCHPVVWINSTIRWNKNVCRVLKGSKQNKMNLW